MKLMIFHQHFKLPSQAGSSRMFNFAKALGKKGHMVTLITGSSCRIGAKSMGFSIKKRSPFSREFFINENIKIISVIDFYDQKLNFFFRTLSFISFAVVSTLIAFGQPSTDVVVASSTPLTIVIPAIAISILKRKQFVLEIRDLWPEAPIRLGVLKNNYLIAILRKLENSAYRYADSIIGISKGICRKISMKSCKPVHFIPHMVDNEFFEMKEVQKHENINVDQLRIVYTGSCGYNNAIEVIFKVANKVLVDDEISSLTNFIIVGEGPALEKLKHNIPHNVVLMGKMPKKEARKILIESDIAFFSQRRVENSDIKKDSLGNKFFDFLGASLPIVTGAVKDGEMAQEIISNKCGVVVEPENVDALYRALKKVILSKQLREKMSLSSGRLALSYSGNMQSDKFISVLEKVNSTQLKINKRR